MTAKDLKNALLQEAVQGKLVPQIASEGNAKDLLEEIKKEKAKLIKEGKLKKEKPLPEIAEDEIPFDIPKNWCWCRLGEIVEFGKCENAEPNEINDEDWVLDLEDIEKDTGKILSFKIKKDVDSKSTKHIFKKDFVLYSKLRPYLNKCVIAPKDGFCTSEILPLDFGHYIYNRYAQLYLMSPFFVDYTNSLSYGVKMPRLGTDDGKNALFPLPPLAEQKRIVTSIEQFIPLIEEYDKKEAELTALNADIAKTLKNAILQEAVQGKLAPQIANDGNAKDLLEEIKQEKAKLIKDGKLKKEKPLPEITEDEIPFDIPDNWCWCRLGDIVKQFLVPQRDKPKNFSGNIPWCRIEDIEGMYLNGTHSNQYVSLETVKSMNLKVNPIGTVISANSASIGAAAITTVECCTNQTFIGLLCSDALYNYYLYYYLKAITDKLKKMGSGTTISYISQDKYKEMPFPLPPLAEQKRIVEIIEKMLPLCKKI